MDLHQKHQINPWVSFHFWGSQALGLLFAGQNACAVAQAAGPAEAWLSGVGFLNRDMILMMIFKCCTYICTYIYLYIYVYTYI